MRQADLTEEHPNLASVEQRLIELSNTQGGAWSFSNVFGKTRFYRAEHPSRLPEHLIDETSLYRDGGLCAFKGELRSFTRAAQIRQQNRGVTSD